MPTHYPGALVDLDALYALAKRHRLRVIEDAALVLGSRWKGRNVGAIGDLVTFSFHPNKNITSIEGGALVVNDDAEAKARRGAALPRHHAICADRTRDVAFPGGKFNLPDVNARIGVAQLEQAAGVSRASAARWSIATSRASPPTRRACCRRGPRAPTATSSWNMFCVLLPLDRMTMSRKAFPRRARSARHRDGGLVRGAAPVHARPPLTAAGTASFRTPSASRARP